MRRILLAIIAMMPLCVYSQELRLYSFSEDRKDLAGSIYSKVDNNDVPCALVKVQCVYSNLRFSGNIIGDVSFKDSEYWVYMSAGSKRLKISSDGCTPLNVEFSEYGIRRVESKSTYVMKISIERKQLDKEWRSSVKRNGFSVGVSFPTIDISASNMLTSVVDYAASDVEGLEELEIPYYEDLSGFSVSYDRQIPIFGTFSLNLGAEVSYLSFKNNFKNSDLVYTINGVSYLLNYGNTEKYELVYASIPVLIGYTYPISKKFGIGIDVGVLFSLGLSGKCYFDGYSNCEWDAEAESNISGNYDLFSGDYALVQSYTKGGDERYVIRGTTINSPYSFGNVSGQVKFGINISRFTLSVQYRIGLLNMANPKYWADEDGGRVSGLLFFGETVSSTYGVKSYVQKINSLSLVLTYKF